MQDATDELPVVIRQFNHETDTPFVMQSWLKSVWDPRFNNSGQPLSKGNSQPSQRGYMLYGMKKHVFMKHGHQLFTDILNRPSTVTLLAVHQDDPDQIYGYVVGEKRLQALILHWVYVKGPFRNFGIAHKLAEAVGLQPNTPFLYTLRTPTSKALFAKFPELRGFYDPLALFPG